MSISWRLMRYDEVDSTQNVLRDLADKDGEEGLVVVAAAQTSGRGRHGRVWDSEGGNLYFSLLLRPDCGPEMVGQIALLIGAALASALKGLINQSEALVLKWPNDVLFQGKKCSGILLETELNSSNGLDYVLVGVGVNLASAPIEVGIALSDFLKTRLSAENVLAEILREISVYYDVWQQQGFDIIRKKWLCAAHKVGVRLQVRLGDEVVSGEFQGIDDRGGLLIFDDLTGVERLVSAGDVYIQE